MENIKIEGLEFHEEHHIYMLNGVQLPSVTTIMKPLSDRYYGSVSPDVLREAAERGTAVHNSIEDWLKYQIEDCPEELSGYFNAYREWEKKYSPIIVSSEQRVYHPLLRYAGCADLLCEIGGKLVLVDFKTSYETSEGLYGVQLEAYAQALRAHKIIVEEKRVLHLKPNGSYDELLYPGVDPQRWVVFGALNTVYNYAVQLKK